MQSQFPQTPGPRNGRMQWGSYGFIAGIVLGVMIGWMFSGFVGLVVRFGLFLLILIPVVLLYMGYRKFVAPVRRAMTQTYQATTPAPYSASFGAIETPHTIRQQTTPAREPQMR